MTDQSTRGPNTCSHFFGKGDSFCFVFCLGKISRGNPGEGVFLYKSQSLPSPYREGMFFPR